MCYTASLLLACCTLRWPLNRREPVGGMEVGGGEDSGALGRKVALMHIYARARVCALPCRAAAPRASGEHAQLRAGGGICISSLGVRWLLEGEGGSGGSGGSCFAPVAGLFSSEHVESWAMNSDAGILPHGRLRSHPAFKSRARPNLVAANHNLVEKEGRLSFFFLFFFFFQSFFFFSLTLSL